MGKAGWGFTCFWEFFNHTLYICISTNSIGNDTWWILFFRIQSSSIRLTDFDFSVISVVYITEKNGLNANLVKFLLPFSP